MKKENLIVLFYIIYFSWLLMVTFLNPITLIINGFTLFIALFYLLFLRETEDIMWFIISACVPLLFAIVSIRNFEVRFDVVSLKYMPIWLPIAWGTTIVALRKFFNMITR